MEEFYKVRDMYLDEMSKLIESCPIRESDFDTNAVWILGIQKQLLGVVELFVLNNKMGDKLEKRTQSLLSLGEKEGEPTPLSELEEGE